MRLRQFIRNWVPPVIAGWWRSENASLSRNWRGVYPRFSDVPVVNPVFGEGLIKVMSVEAQVSLDQCRSGKKPYLWHEALGLLAGFICTRQTSLRVVDFGGGLGTGYLQLKTRLPENVGLDYLIVDGEPMCERGRDLFREYGELRFAAALPKPGATLIDIIYANSVLQYIEDYRAQLQALAAMEAPYLLLARLAAGDCPTFVAEQINVLGQVLPYWFLNVKELTGILAEMGYRLVCDELTARVYDQSVYPETHRVERFRDMLFVRKTSRVC